MKKTENKVRFGLSNVAIAPIVNGVWQEPIKVPGAVSLTINPNGDSSSFKADNVPYYTVVTNSGYEGDIEMALWPDEVLAAMGLQTKDANGAYYEDADQVPVPYALLYQVNGDQRNRFNVLYNCTSQRPSSEEKTKEDSTSVTTQKLSFTTIPKEIDGRNITKLSIEPDENNVAVCDGFYDEVLVPANGKPTGPADEGSEGPEKTLDEMSITELKAYASAHGIDLGDATLKADILAAIKAAEGAAGDGNE